MGPVEPNRKRGKLSQIQFTPTMHVPYNWACQFFAFKFNVVFLIRSFLALIYKSEHTFSLRTNENVGQQRN